MSKEGKGKVVVVTGASAGVGRATVREFAKRGASIALIARGRAKLEATRAEVEAAGGRALVLPLDVSDEAAVENAAQQVEDTFGPIDCWINNAMLSVFSPIKEMQPAEYRRVTEVTYLGYVWGTLAALKRMLPRDRGTIVQVGSALAYRAIPLQSAYCAAKHAVEGFTESLRCELLHDGSNVRVTIIQLPAVNTPQFNWVKSRLPGMPQPVPPIYQPEVIAKAIIWAIEHNRPELYVGFSTVKAIVGNKIAPRFADRYLARHGYGMQQRRQSDDPRRPDNLWKPVERDFAAHGDFEDRSRSWSWQFWLSKNGGVVTALSLLAAGLYAAFRQKRSPQPRLEAAQPSRASGGHASPSSREVPSLVQS